MTVLERSELDQLIARLRADYQALLYEARRAVGGLDDTYRITPPDPSENISGSQPASGAPSGFDAARFACHVQAIRDVEAAFRRIRMGVYGICMDCGERIGFDRLQAYPTAKRCLACQKRHEEARTAPAHAKH